MTRPTLFLFVTLLPAQLRDLFHVSSFQNLLLDAPTLEFNQLGDFDYAGNRLTHPKTLLRRHMTMAHYKSFTHYR